jgi:hypothetical protein
VPYEDHPTFDVALVTPDGSAFDGEAHMLVVPGQAGEIGVLAVMKAPLPAAGAILLQTLGWLLQLFAVWVAMRAFDIDAPLPAAGLVLLLMNVATVFPLWPGNIGLLQAAVALPLRQYGVAYATGFAYGLVLQVIEMSVGVGVGVVMLAREGLSFASLQRMEEAEESQEDVLLEQVAETSARSRREGARVAS